MAYPSTSNQKPRRTSRVIIFQVVMAVSFLLLAIRTYQIQFLEGPTHALQADENRLDIISVPATRGIIVDRYEAPLAVNVASANVVVTPALLPSDDAESMAILEHVAGLIGIPLSGKLTTRDERGILEESLLTMVQTGENIAPYRGVVVKKDIDHEIARILLAEDLPGVEIQWVSVRDYPSGALTAHLIGYMGPIPASAAEDYEAADYVLDRDRIGYDGLEFMREDFLAGRLGKQLVERDVAGQIVAVLQEIPPQPGYSIQLTIDLELQRRAQEHLEETLENMRQLKPEDLIGFDRGVVIAMNPRTGEILAMVSSPSYDNQRFARGIDYPYYQKVSEDPKNPLFNQATNSLYPPGSIFKVLTATAILEEGIVTPDYEIQDPGSIKLENRYYANEPSQAQTFVCWVERGRGIGHESVNLINALAWSCDVYFYKVGGGYTDPENGREEVAGIGLGIERLAAWMEIFGLGERTGIELPGEVRGTVPNPAWKRQTWGENWSTGDTYNSAFGQGYVLTTPIQMLTVMNTIINNGMTPRPTLIHEVRDADGNVVQGFEPDLVDIRDGIEEYWPDYSEHSGPYPNTLDATLRIVQEGMRQATIMDITPIQQGTAIQHQKLVEGVAVAGKTGTAEFCDNIAAALDRCTPGAWPAHAWYMGYAPYVNPEISVIAFVYNGQEGSTVALPIVAAVMNDYYELKRERLIQEEEQLPTPPPPALPPPTATP